MMGEFEKSILQYQRALEIDRVLNDWTYQADHLSNIGKIYFEQNKVDKAIIYYKDALEVARKTLDRNLLANVVAQLGYSYKAINSMRIAKEYFEKSLKIASDEENLEIRSKMLYELGSLFRSSGLLDKANERFLHALDCARQINYHSLEVDVLKQLGSLNMDKADYVMALKYFHDAINVYKKSKINLIESASVLCTIGSIYTTQLMYREAIEYYDEALMIYQEVGNLLEQANVLGNLSMVYHSMGDKNKAMKFEEEAIKTALELGEKLSPTIDLEKMFHNWEKLEGINSIYSQKLTSYGILSSDMLLRKGATPLGRNLIALETGINPNIIVNWVNRLDLSRIEGVGEEYADLLEQSGVVTIYDLQSRDPEFLFQRLVRINKEHKIVRRLPTKTQVINWIEQAKILERIITY